MAIQGDAKRVGIDVKVENVLKQKQDELIFANGYDLLPIRWVNNSASVLYIPFTSANIPGAGQVQVQLGALGRPDARQAARRRRLAATSPAEAAKLYTAGAEDDHGCGDLLAGA